jgi:hypothetical protein
MDIPYVGTLIIQNGISGVKFLDPVVEEVRVYISFTKPTINRKPQQDKSKH